MESKLQLFDRVGFIVTYWLLVISPVPFIVVSTFEYFYVKARFGIESGTEDYIRLLAIEKHVTLHIPTHQTGLFLLAAFICSILSFSLVILANYIMSLFSKGFPFYKRLAKLSAIVNVAAYIIGFHTEWGVWYGIFLVD